MDAPNPAGQVALVGEARSCGDLGKADISIPHHFNRMLQPQMNHVAIRTDADGLW